MTGRTAIIADDHELLRAALAELLRREFDFRHVIEAGSLDEAMGHLAYNPAADFATIDLKMPGMKGPSSLRMLRETYPRLTLAVITAFDRREDILMALSAGVHGYIPKTLRIAEIGFALRVVLDGGIFVPPAIAGRPASAVLRTVGVTSERPAQAQAPSAPLGLSARQADVSRLMVTGKTNKEIARALGLAEGTIKVHVNALYRTLGAKNRVSAVAAMAERNLGPVAERSGTHPAKQTNANVSTWAAEGPAAAREEYPETAKILARNSAK